jgi:uncharacterized protein (DUF1778 family)
MTPLPKHDERIELRVASEDLDSWRAAAERERMTLSDWMRRACRAAADKSMRRRSK